MWDFVNKSKYRMCISSVQKANGNSIEFSLSTQTRRVIKSSQTKSLQYMPLRTTLPWFENLLYRECKIAITIISITWLQLNLLQSCFNAFL